MRGKLKKQIQEIQFNHHWEADITTEKKIVDDELMHMDEIREKNFNPQP